MQAELNSETGFYEDKVDDKPYEFEKWGAEESLKTLLKVTKIAGEPIGLAVAAIMGKGEKGKSVLDSQFDPDMLAKAFKCMTQSLDESMAFDLIKKFATDRVYADKARVVSFDKQYHGALPHALKVAWANMQVQYGNFFEGSRGGEGPAPGMAPISNRVP